MIIESITVPLETFEKEMNLPSGTKVVSACVNSTNDTLVLKIAIPNANEPLQPYMAVTFKDIGEGIGKQLT